MKTEKVKQKAMNEAQLLELLKQVLPKATHDAKLAGAIYSAVEQQLKIKGREKAFEKFCSRCELPDLEAPNIEAVRRQLADSFGAGDITIKPNKKENALAVEVSLPDGAQFQGLIKVGAHASEEGEETLEIPLKFVPFPVSLPGDKELVWELAMTENLTADEAGIALAKVEEEFWASKTGQKLIRDRVERSFPEFIERVPAAMLKEVGLKRHYKTPETLKVLQQIKPGKK